MKKMLKDMKKMLKDMKKMLKAVILLTSVSMLSAFISTRSYVDPQYRKANYDSIQRLSIPMPVKLDANFQRNGKPLPAVDSVLRGHVERILRASGVFTPTNDANVSATLGVTANNIVNLAAARAKGFGTGLTFGAAGSMVDDNYEFKFSFRNGANQQNQAVCQHAIHTTIGHATGPSGVTPITSSDAFGRVVEDVVLNFVKELQDKGLVPLQTSLKPITQPPAILSSASANENLTLMIQRYAQRGYKVISESADRATLERPATKFNTWLLVLLIFLVGIGAIVYVTVYYIWAIRKSYNVQLVVGLDGQVQELGNTLQEFEQDKLQASQKRHLGFGIFFAILGGIVFIMSLFSLVGELVNPYHVGLGTSLLVFVTLSIPTTVPAVFLLRRAKKIKDNLNANAI